MTKAYGIIAALILTASFSAQAQQAGLVHDFHTGTITTYVVDQGWVDVAQSGDPRNMLATDNALYLYATTSAGTNLFQLDDLSGTPVNHGAVGGLLGGRLAASGDQVFVYTGGGMLALGDDGPVELCSFQANAVLTLTTDLIPLPGGKLLFPGHDAEHGYELWITDGTVAGTHLVKDINPGTGSGVGGSQPRFNGFEFQGKAYFTGHDGTDGTQLWVTDGTPGGTHKFANMNPSEEDGLLGDFAWSKNEDRFIVRINRYGLLSSDGTTDGTFTLVEDGFIGPGKPGLHFPAPEGEWMYFTDNTVGQPVKFFRTKGTEATTEWLADYTGGPGVHMATVLNGKVYVFSQIDGNNVLAAIDPTDHSTTPIVDFEDYGGVTPHMVGFLNDGERFFFGARVNITNGQGGKWEWFVSDGTAAGTSIIPGFEVPTGAGYGRADQLAFFQGKFVFAANRADVGTELFVYGAGDSEVGIQEEGVAHDAVRAWVDADGDLVVWGQGARIKDVRVMDLSGKLVMERTGMDRTQVWLPGDRLGSGIYLVQVFSPQGVHTVKVAVAK